MRKLIQIITFALLYFGVKAQTFTTIHNYQAPDGLEVIKHLGIPYGTDTSDYILPDTVKIAGIPRKSAPVFFQTTDSTFYIHWGKWIAVGKGSGGGGACDTCISTILPNSDTTQIDFKRVNGTTAFSYFPKSGGGGGGSGTVTSVAKGYGILADGTITTTGTVTVDSAALALKFKRLIDSTNVNTLSGGKIDTAHIPNTIISVFHQGTGLRLLRPSNDTLYSSTLNAGTGVTLSKGADSSITINATGGGLNISVNDSLAKGFKISDSSVTGQTNNPTTLNWNLVNKQRVFALIDNNFIHYKSAFEIGQSNEFTALTGRTPTILNGKLSVIGSGFITTQNAPTVPFFTIELSIHNIGTAYVDTNLIGPSLIKDSTHYLAGYYNYEANKFGIMLNGSIVNSATAIQGSIDPTNLIMYLVLKGNTVSLWAKSRGVISNPVSYVSTYDFTVSGNLSGYKYGIFSSQTVSDTVSINSLRAGASGGVGLINNRLVRNSDGSPFVVGNKVLFTADWTSSVNTTHGYTSANSTVFAMDLDNYSVESIGHFYFNHSLCNTVTNRILGGQYVFLRWFPDKKKWLLTYTLADCPDGTGYNLPIQYAWLDYQVPFGENILKQYQLSTFSGTAPSLTGENYGGNIRYDTATSNYYMLTDLGPRMFYGKSLSTFNNQVIEDTGYNELATWAKLGGKWYEIYWSFRDSGIVKSFPTLATLGFMKLPAGTNNYTIRGYDWLTYQKNGKTSYLLVGFDTTDLNSAQWSRGNLIVWKSDSTSTGYEFPNIVQNQIPIQTTQYPENYITAAPVATPVATTLLSGIVSITTQSFGGAKTFVKSPLTLDESKNGGTNFLVKNTTTGVSAESGISFQTDANTSKLSYYSSGTNPYGIITPNTFYLYGAGTGGVAILADSATAPLKFSAGGHTEQMRLNPSGNLGIGSTSDNGYKLYVNGTAKVFGDFYTNLTPTSIPFIGAANNLSKSANFVYDSTNNRVGIGLTPLNPLDISKSQSAATNIRISNASASSGAATGLVMVTSASGTTTFGAYGSGTSFGSIGNGMAYIYNDISAGGMAFIAAGGSGTIRFATGGISEKARFASTGNLLLNTTTDDGSSLLQVNGNINLITAGNKIKIATGTNASVGVSGAMTAGTITISTTAVTASSKIFLTAATVGGTQGFLSVGTITAGTSFVINSSSALDTSTVNWWIIN